ncbi:MAG: Cof-type HAD-IIB family hydrolase [Bacilli bacterium]|nr:Cof-type HAD-IIB family hydrolase [Bacilli bacterium]
MDRYLIAFDMDGTLLTEKKKISFLTLHYLRKLTKKGHLIVLASGRPSRALYSYYNQLKLKTPMICYNGAYTFSPYDKDFPPFEFEFPKEVVQKLYKELHPYIEHVMCEDDTDIWVDKEDLYLDRFFWYKGMNIHKGDISEILTKNPMTMIAQKKEDLKDNSPIDNIVKQYKDIDVRYWTGSPYLELYFKCTSKGASVKKIAEYYNIPKEKIIVFGDAENDVEMFQIAGTSIAMKNGKESLKKHATHVSIKDNENNGIYHTLKKIIKI